MSSDAPVISARGIAKRYQLGGERPAYDTLRESLLRSFSRHRSAGASRDFWALDDVSFEVRAGDVVGIVGRNGAGKSTLLKVLARITEPTRGRIELRGRVGSLLEVGTGFHPELTGRENVFLNGSILGMRKREISAKFDEIVAFSEVERFIDTPVKRYSSGMYLKLAFAVAAHLEPEILIVDEVLAVGDAAFQRKCLSKMQEISHTGRTVLFVSHNMSAVARLCNRGILLSAGRVAVDGPVEEAVAAYLATAGDEQAFADGVEKLRKVEDRSIRFLDVRFLAPSGPASVFYTHEPVAVEVDVDLLEPQKELRFGWDLFDENGVHVFRTFADDDVEDPPLLSAGRYRFRSEIPPNFLRESTYQVALAVGIQNLRWIIHAGVTLPLVVLNSDGFNRAYGDRRPGSIMPLVPWTIERRDPGDGAAEADRSIGKGLR